MIVVCTWMAADTVATHIATFAGGYPQFLPLSPVTGWPGSTGAGSVASFRLRRFVGTEQKDDTHIARYERTLDGRASAVAVCYSRFGLKRAATACDSRNPLIPT